MKEGTVKASIITIGDELLIGQVIDTNSAWIAAELNKNGILLRRRIAVGDVWDEIWQALDEEQKDSDIVIITGGLGPTADDITKELLCKYFGGKLVMNEEVLLHIQNIFARLNRPMLERNTQQALVPDNCTVLHNERGTAPGMWFEKDEKVFVSIPGVPHEMKGLMNDIVLEKLLKHFIPQTILHRTLVTMGIGESFLAEHIKDFEAALPAFIKLAYLPNYGIVRLRLTAMGTDKYLVESTLNNQFNTLSELVAQWRVATEDITMQELIARNLRNSKQTLCTAESCTGGFLAHLFTREAGASDFFKGSIISYANDLKENLLGVSKQTLQSNGAVSEQTVSQMVKGALEATGSDLAIATSGIMGPGGGSIEKPVGTVWIGVGNKTNITVREFHFRNERSRNIELASSNALNMLRIFMMEHPL